VLALLALLALALPSGARAVTDTDWLGRVNEIRLGSQLQPVVENQSWSAGIAAHLYYLANTPSSYRTGEYESAHTENPASPYYTPEGDKEGRSSDLTFSSASNVDAINVWLTAPFHAIGILRPNLLEVAFARETPSGAAGLDVINGLFYPAPEQLVLFPGPGSTIDLPRFGGELPTPLETCEAQHPGVDYGSAGLPLIALLTETPDPGLTAQLSKPDGSTDTSAGDLCVITTHNFVTSDSVYGPAAAAILSADSAVVIVPRLPLVAGTYTARISQPGRPEIAWSFLSSPPPEPAFKLKRLPRVRFGRPRFRRGYVNVLLDNRRSESAARVRLSATAARTRLVFVGGRQTKRVRAHLRHHGRSHVALWSSGHLLGRRVFVAPRARRR
jgi:hypothetical protein